MSGISLETILALIDLAARPCHDGADFVETSGRLQALTGCAGKFNLYDWKWNEEGMRLAGHQSTRGVLANEVQEILPEAVMERDGHLMVSYFSLREAQVAFHLDFIKRESSRKERNQ